MNLSAKVAELKIELDRAMADKARGNSIVNDAQERINTVKAALDIAIADAQAAWDTIDAQ